MLYQLLRVRETSRNHIRRMPLVLLTLHSHYSRYRPTSLTLGRAERFILDPLNTLKNKFLRSCPLCPQGFRVSALPRNRPTPCPNIGKVTPLSHKTYINIYVK